MHWEDNSRATSIDGEDSEDLNIALYLLVTSVHCCHPAPFMYCLPSRPLASRSYIVRGNPLRRDRAREKR